MVALHHHLPEHLPPAVSIRDLGPADEHLVERLHHSLSPRSQYQRFHGAKPRLTKRELRFLAATDGHDHVALVALERGQPVAIARYVRWAGRPRAADIAAEVVDGRQRRGLGSELIAKLARRAVTQGVERFTATVLSETGLAASLTRRGWSITQVDGPTITLEVPVWRLL